MPVKAPVPSWLEPQLPVGETIAAQIHLFAEVAVHDLRRDRLVGIWNPFSAGKLGERPLIDKLSSCSRRTG